MTKQRYSNRVEYLIRLTPGTDERAPGAAVSVGLCGHWDHAGPCPWPHYSTIHPQAGEDHLLVVEFDAPDSELEMVKNRIAAALGHGELTGPDGRHSTWSIES